jgi:hypothetical protein
MSTSVRPDPAPGIPSIPRVLGYDEWKQADALSPAGIKDANFPTLPPPPPASRDAAYTAAGLIPPDDRNRPKLPKYARILTQYVAEPLWDHPIMTMASLLPPVAAYYTGRMAKDVLEYSAQKAAELSLPEHERKLAEQDPERISGEQAAVEGTMLAAAPLVHGVMKAKVGKPAIPEGLSAAIDHHVTSFSDSWRSLLAPATRTPESRAAANIVRANTGEMAAAYEQSAYRLDDFRRAIDPLPETDKLGFIDAYEGGRSQASPEFAKGAEAIKETLDDLHSEVQALGPGHLDGYIQNFMPHYWSDPERASEVFKAEAQKRSLEGSESFRKERVIPTTLDGIKLGLEPVTTNPVDLALLKVREMQKYLMAHRTLNEMKTEGLVKYVPAGEQAPENYARIDDRIATVFGPREGAVTIPEGSVKALAFDETGALEHAEPLQPEDVSVQGLRIMGDHWAPEPVARIVNNYLSPGMRGGYFYDLYRQLGNSLNLFQLGLSGFHLGFTSVDATTSRVALGLEYLASGKPLEGLQKLATAPTAALPGIFQGLLGDAANAFTRTRFSPFKPTNIEVGLGAKIRTAYLDPEAAASPEILALANAVKEAGGRIKMDSFYRNSAPERLIEHWKQGEYGRAAGLSLPAVFELTMKPLMEHIVPLQKLGVFGELAQKVLSDLPPDASIAQRRAALAGAWDSVDNRMGQLVYDNVFWNRRFKDLSMASVRSVGWNVGTIREIGGGGLNLAKAVKDVATGERVDLSHSAFYVMALPITVGTLGAIYQYLRTGEGPQDIKDAFYPRTGEYDADGNAERVQLPSYTKDIAAYYDHAWSTVKHKANPIISTVVEMLNNEDFYGDQIRNPTDPFVQQIAQEAGYIAKQLTPFAYRNFSESQQRGDQSRATKLGNWFGVTPAPRSEVRSEAQNKMADYLSSRRMEGATPEEADARKSRAELLAAMRGQSNVNLQDAVTNAIERHQLTAPDIVKLLKRAGTTPAQEKFKRLTLVQAIDVFKASTPAEKLKFTEGLLKKLERQIQGD